MVLSSPVLFVLETTSQICSCCMKHILFSPLSKATLRAAFASLADPGHRKLVARFWAYFHGSCSFTLTVVTLERRIQPQNCKSWMVSSKVGQRKKILKFEASQGGSSLQEAEGKYVAAQGGNASSTRLLRNGDGKCGLGCKCWNCWQVNPQAQLLKATALWKSHCCCPHFCKGFPSSWKYSVLWRNIFFAGGWNMGRDLLTLSCWVPVLIHKPWQMKGQQGCFLCVRLCLPENI